jgi:ABC-type polysaccharide/polyol phosphate transport system ATPase subunit
MMERIRFHNVSKSFSLTGGRKLMGGHLLDWFRRTENNTFYALRNISLTVNDGESLAVVGANGAGKSTLLNLATRLCYPDEGEVQIRGRLAALLELGSGFHNDLTGAENLRISASLLGLGRDETAERFGPIVEFSGLGEFIHQPLRTYSAGMMMRLAFSVAIHTDPDIVLIDEVISVGDQAFQDQCFERMAALRRAGKTMVCVSHSPTLLRRMCDRAIWLDHGQLMAQGSLEEVLASYEGRVTPAGRGTP